LDFIPTFSSSKRVVTRSIKSLDPIPTKRASVPVKAKKQTTPWHSLPTQGETTREDPLGLNLKEMLLGMILPVGGQLRGSEGTKEVIFD
jgi:hypothetical protein